MNNDALTCSGFQTEDGRHGKHPDQKALKISSLCEEHTRGIIRGTYHYKSALSFFSSSFKYCYFDPGVCSFKRHHQAVRGTSRAGQALQTFRHEKVPTEREQRAEETVSRQKVKTNYLLYE